ncbi:ABC transporter permease [Micrococcus sp. ACRRV]|uniref:ABC transporter permease subunit n=1 Tax=Micrococcus sp. ACRRV TaxID=2918203 RepID=UPI001EF2F41B|nr:ABC transporter permease subunit [Micrococcus sp. ACRRV]MCG7421919.1 ABC transporter permease [Micrococcus sp. ACRRV]
MKAEFRKFLTVRSWWATAIFSALLAVGSAAAASFVTLGLAEELGSPEALLPGDGAVSLYDLSLQVPSSGIVLALFVLGVVATLQVASEFTTGTGLFTFSYAAGRLNILWAKLSVMLVVGLLLIITSYLASRWIAFAVLNSRGFGPGTGGGDLWRELTAVVLSAALIISLAVGMAAIVRSVTVSILVMAVLMFIAPGVLSAFSSNDVAKTISRFVPGSLVDAAVDPLDFDWAWSMSDAGLSNGAALLCLLAWSCLALSGGVLCFWRVDFRRV